MNLDFGGPCRSRGWDRAVGAHRRPKYSIGRHRPVRHSQWNWSRYSHINPGIPYPVTHNFEFFAVTHNPGIPYPGTTLATARCGSGTATSQRFELDERTNEIKHSLTGLCVTANGRFTDVPKNGTAG